nr:unnamed protein product [Digitaria exilis]
MHERINELLVSTEAGPGSGRDVLSDDLYGERGDPVHLGRESHQRRDERERESAGGERPLGGAAEEEPCLSENRLRLIARGGGERGREAHGAVERGGVIKAGKRREGQLGGNAGDKVGEGGRGAEGGLGRLGDGEREAVGARDEQGAGGGEGGEEGGVRAGELAAGGGLGHAERLLGAQRREAEAGGDGGDDGGGAGYLLAESEVLRTRVETRRSRPPESLKVAWWTNSDAPPSWMRPQEVQTSTPESGSEITAPSPHDRHVEPIAAAAGAPAAEGRRGRRGFDWKLTAICCEIYGAQI